MPDDENAYKIALAIIAGFTLVWRGYYVSRRGPRELSEARATPRDHALLMLSTLTLLVPLPFYLLTDWLDALRFEEG